VLSAYRAGWAAYEQASATSNALDPSLAKTMANPLLEQVRKWLVADYYAGIIGVGSTALHPRVESQSPSRAVIVDCTFSRSFLVYKKTGKQVPPVTKPEYDGVRSVLVRYGATWKVQSQQITEGSCPAGY
jgi:hypothetical protein